MDIDNKFKIKQFNDVSDDESKDHKEQEKQKHFTNEKEKMYRRKTCNVKTQWTYESSNKDARSGISHSARTGS